MQIDSLSSKLYQKGALNQKKHSQLQTINSSQNEVENEAFNSGCINIREVDLKKAPLGAAHLNAEKIAEQNKEVKSKALSKAHSQS